MSTLTPDCQAWLDEQESQFMRPETALLTEREALASCEQADEQEIESADDTGYMYYARLSAPGYLDCTDWIGPYLFESQALEALYEMFGE